MKARLVVFPIKGRNWCFSRSHEPSVPQSEHARPSPKLKDLWKKISSDGKPMAENAETVVDFIAEKMNRGWIGLEKAPEGTFKNKLYGFGLRLLAGVKPSEIFLKSFSKDVTKVEVTYPTRLSPHHVRRRLRHIAMRGTIIHKRYLYGSVSLLPFTAAFAVLPLPNIPFFWVLFRTYSHWRALKVKVEGRTLVRWQMPRPKSGKSWVQDLGAASPIKLEGSERLLVLVSNCTRTGSSASATAERGQKGTSYGDSEFELPNSPFCHWVLQPSEELEKLLKVDDENGLSKCTITEICRVYKLDTKEVLKYRSL